jgi:hypothetical protein
MRKWFVGAAALGLLVAVAMPGSANAAQRNAAVGAKANQAIEVGSQYRGHRRAYHRPYRGYASPLYGPRYFAPRAIVPGYYPAWYTPYYDDYGYRSYGYGGYGGYGYGGYGYGYRPFISIGFPGFGIWF